MPLDLTKYSNPVRISTLIQDGMQMEVHCHTCAHYKLLDPATLPFDPETPVFDLAKRFKCSRCKSTETEARPHYTRD